MVARQSGARPNRETAGALNFRLEPHHLPPGIDAPLEAPADATFSLPWKGRQREVALRWMRLDKFAHVLWVRVDGEIWLASRLPNTALEAPMKWKVPQHSPRKMLSIARTVERGHTLGLTRLLVFPPAQDGPQMVLACTEGGIWLDAQLEIVGEFSLDIQTNADESKWQTTFEAAWNDDQSDARFAWNWAKKSEDERRAWFYEGTTGITALGNVVRLVLQSADELWEKHEFVCWIHGFDANESWFGNEYRGIVDAKNEAPRLERWRRFFDRHLWKAEFRTAWSHRVMREWICKQCELWGVYIEVARPSAHERLESRLELRDWLRENTSLQQRRWLMPP